MQGNESDNLLPDVLHAREVHVINVPLIKIIVHEIDDRLSIIDINGNIFACANSPIDARAKACSMLINSAQSIIESVDTFVENELDSFIAGKFTAETGEPNAPPKVP